MKVKSAQRKIGYLRLSKNSGGTDTLTLNLRASRNLTSIRLRQINSSSPLMDRCCTISINDERTLCGMDSIVIEELPN